jgi:hypothetical protein
MKMPSRTRLLLLAVLLLPSPLSSQCKCGIPVKNDLQYIGPHSEGGDPDPSVARISEHDGRMTVWVQYFFSRSDATHAVRTRDGGRTWQPDPQFHETPFLHSETLSVVYKASQNGLLQRSLDNGVHWVECKFNVNGLSPQRFAATASHNDRGILNFSLSTIDPRTPATIYGNFWVGIGPKVDAETYSGSPVALPGVYVSHDAGDTWTMFAPDLRSLTANEMTQLGIDPSNPQKMIGHARSGMVITTDGGKTWQPVGQQSELEIPAELRGRKEALEALVKSGGTSFAPLHPDIAHLLIQQVAFQPGNSNVIYLVTNKGLYKSADSARTWCLIYTGTPPLLFGIRSLFFDPEDANRLYVGTAKTVLVSDDGGCHFRTFFDWDTYIGKHNGRPVPK